MYQKYQDYSQLTNSLKTACQLIDLNKESTLYKDVIAVCNHLANTNFQIAVFGPFNHGKSTLLNAILGNRTLPIDLIPTTGAAITVKYGEALSTRIMLVDGTEIYRSGTEVLQQFAILDGDRQMRKDVASVEVFCPHPFLERNVEFIDLPGTNDREAQDNLVKDRLIGADLVIQLLDARKLMTLGERENLRDWLLDRGIKTVIFVANFLNLLEPEEQKQVYNRLLFVAESFRADLPPGFSNLYRVDALPALRARLKGDVALANSSGLAAFETALQQIVGIFQQDNRGSSLPRIEKITSQLQPLFFAQVEKIRMEIKTFDDREKAKIEVKEKAKNLIHQGFKASLRELKDCLQLSNLLAKYQSDLAVALAENNFISWQTNTLKKDLTELQLNVIKWLYQAYEFFQEERPEDLKLPFPNVPSLNLPPKPNNNSNDLTETGSIAVGSGIGWLLGGPVGAAVVGSISYMLNKNIQKSGEQSSKDAYHQQVAKICIDAAEKYLSDFSSQGLSILSEYEQTSARVINFSIPTEPGEIRQRRENLKRLQDEFNQFLKELEKFNIKTQYQPVQETATTANTQSANTQSANTQSANPETSSHQNSTQYNSTQYKYTKTTTEAKTERKAETPHQQVAPPPPKLEIPEQQVSTPPPNPAELEAKFRTWELDEEIAEMKANIKYGNKHETKNQQPKNPPKTQEEKDKINHAYQVLGLQDTVTFAEVKQTYKNLVKKWHPDLFVNQPHMQKQVQEKMRLVNAAYNILESYYSYRQSS